ncbi:MAG: lysophospholipid acyltransferase family protein [Pseudomonadota bacterium]
MLAKHLRNFWQPKYWPTWLGLLIFRGLSFLPLRVLAILGYGLGALIYVTPFGRRNIALINLRACFPEKTEKELKRINFQHFCYMGQSILTTSMNWWIGRARFDRLIEISEREHYDKALDEGKNIILLTPHFMAIEVSGLALQRERPMIGVYQYMKNTLMDTIAKEGRSRFTSEGLMFERKEPLRTLLRWIRKGHPMAYSPDQDAMRKGVFVPFFHPLASTTPALAKFIQTTHAVVIPCMTRMKPWGRGYEVILGEIQPNLNTGDELADTAAMNRVIEQMVRSCPEQYLWVHKRFKTRPPGEASLYP